MGARLEGSMGRLSGIPSVIIANLAERERERSWIESVTHISYSENIHSDADYSISIPDSKSLDTRPKLAVFVSVSPVPKCIGFVSNLEK